MLVARHGWIPDLIGVHLENLESLWHQRHAILFSSTHHAWDLRRVDTRIAAHADALVLAGEAAFAALGQGLGGETSGMVCAAAHVLLLGETHARSVWGLVPAAAGPAREGLLQALRAGPIGPLLADLQQAALAADQRLAFAAAEVLAIHGETEPAARVVTGRIASVPPTAPGAAALCDLLSLVPHQLGQSGAVQAWLRSGAGAADRDLRRAAMHAAAWTRQPWLLADLRQRGSADPEALVMLGILGEPADLPALLAASGKTALGPARFQALGAFGHPGSLEVLATAMAGADARTAVAAGAAFQRMTGVAPWSTTRVELPAADGVEPDPMEAEFAELACLPLRRSAADWQQQLGASGSGTARLQAGRALDARLAGPDLEGLSLRAATELRMVAHYRAVSEQRRFGNLLPLS
jgi:hypothetical protein